MRKRQHPSDDELFELLDHPAHNDHVEACEPCSARLGEIRRFTGVLREAEVWQPRAGVAPQRREWIDQATAAAQVVSAEMDDAATLVDHVLTGPTAWWRTRVSQSERTRTYGFARRMLERAEKLSDRSPSDAVEATAIAVEVADELRVDAYPFDLVISLRAQAWREHAFALLFVGRFPEALKAVERADQLFAQLALPAVDLARSWVTRALIYRSTDRVPEAIQLTRDAADVFRAYGMFERYVKTRMTEAAMFHQRGSIAEALEVWTMLEEEPALRQDASYGMLLQNIGTAYSQLGQLDRAHEYLNRALAEHEKRGVEPEKTRTRWSIASAYVAGGRLDEALPLLRQVWREFESMQARGSAALVALELAEALLVAGKPSEVPAICRQILDEFTRSGMTSRAITALSFLREAVALGTATPSLVRHVHDFIRDLPSEPARSFAFSPF